jgi:preprotein translocase subunit SecG
MYSFVSVLVALVSVFLVLIVLVQNSKGGGLASNFSASNQVMGVRKTTDFLEKATWTLAGFLLVLSFVAVMVLRPEQRQSGLDEKVEKMSTKTSVPQFPVSNQQPEKQPEKPAEKPAE